MKALLFALVIALVFFQKPSPAPSSAASPLPEVRIKAETKNTEVIPEFDQLSNSQLNNYNSMVWKRAEVIKSRLFKKYYNKYAKQVL